MRLFQKSKAVAFYRVDRADAGIDVGYQPSRFTEFRGGYEIGYTKDALNLGKPDFSSIEGRLGDTHLSFNMDHTDDPIVPTTGFSIATNFHWYDTYPGAINTLPAMDAQLRGFYPVSSKGSVYASAEGGTTFGFLNTGTPLYFLGAPTRLSAYGSNELFTLPPFVGKKVYAVGTYEFAKMYNFTPESGFPTDVEAGVLAETALGPFYIGGSFGDTGHHKWFFQNRQGFLGHASRAYSIDGDVVVAAATSTRDSSGTTRLQSKQRGALRYSPQRQPSYARLTVAQRSSPRRQNPQRALRRFSRMDTRACGSSEPETAA